MLRSEGEVTLNSEPGTLNALYPCRYNLFIKLKHHPLPDLI